MPRNLPIARDIVESQKYKKDIEIPHGLLSRKTQVRAPCWRHKSTWLNLALVCLLLVNLDR